MKINYCVGDKIVATHEMKLDSDKSQGSGDYKFAVPLSKTALINLLEYYRTSELGDFDAICNRPMYPNRLFNVFEGLAIHSIITKQRRLQEWMKIDDVLVKLDFAFPEWSMQSGMVGRNAERFNEEMGYPKWQPVMDLSDYAPISWRRNEWLDVGEGFIETRY